MNKGCVAVLDIGSSKITAFIGEKGVNGVFSIKNSASRRYEGFSDGKFFDENDFERAVISVLDAIQGTYKRKINEIFVGFPGGFAKIENKKYKIVFDGGKKKKILNTDVLDLFYASEKKIIDDDYYVTSRRAVYYIVDGNLKTDKPIGTKSSMLGGNLSFVLAKKSFIDKVLGILSKKGISVKKFIYDAYAEGLSLLQKELRELPCLVVDIGYITTSAVIIYNNGATATFSKDFGGGFITFELLQKFNLDLDLAEGLKRQINLGFTKRGSVGYFVESDEKSVEISVDEANNVVVQSLDYLAESLNQFIEENNTKLDSSSKVYITGGGISYMRGAVEHLSSRLGLQTEILKPVSPQYSKPIESSKISVLDMALKEEKI